jgi:hypothetical protein
MTTGHSLPNPAAQIEILDRSRRRMLASVVATSVLWFVPQIVQGLWAGALPRGLTIVLVLAGIGAAFAWMGFMWRYHSFQQRVLADPDLRSRLDDERVVALRKDAILHGWAVLVAALGVGVAAAPFVDLPDMPVMLLLLLLAVDGPIVAFLILDRD